MEIESQRRRGRHTVGKTYIFVADAIWMFLEKKSELNEHSIMNVVGVLEGVGKQMFLEM